MADIGFMTDYVAWKISGTMVLFLLGCAWHNRFSGYRKQMEANRDERQNVERDVSLIWQRELQPPVTRSQNRSADAFTNQLAKLNLALHGTDERVPIVENSDRNKQSIPARS